MEVKELKSKGLKREFSITIGVDDLKEKKIKKLQDIASKAKIDGFRPGKVPTAHIEKLYGQSVMVEVIEEKVSEASQSVLKDRDLRAAVKPDVKLESDMNDVIEKNKGNIIRVTDLLSNYKPRQRKNIQPIGFVIGDKNLYLTNSDGKIIVADLSDGKITKIEKVSGGLVSEPFIFDNNLFVVRNGSIVQYN